ncbi:MAG: hypothetical protein ACT4OM_02285 [Actinomycetota bacterium]
MIVSVVVDLAVWALDRELSYVVPDDLVGRVRVGSIVRVPLRGRRVRGWVTGLDAPQSAPGNLAPVAAVSGRGPVFDEQLLEMARCLARRYVQPLSGFLALFTPPRMGARTQLWAPPEQGCGTKQPDCTLLRLTPGEDPTERYAGLIAQGLTKGEGAIVVVPEVREGSRVLEQLASAFGTEAAVVHSGLDPAVRSRALWSVAAGRRKLVLGGRSALFAPPLKLGTIVVHQEHDPSLKHQQAPYYDAREAALARAQATRARVVFASATPSLRPEYWSGGYKVAEPARQAERAAWPAVEVVEPARRGLPQRAIACLIEAKRTGGRSIVLLPRVEATASGAGLQEMVELIKRILPDAVITRADRPALGAEPGALREALEGEVIVATEAALAEVSSPRMAVAVAMGVDGYLRRPRGRSAEEAVETLWALAGTVAGPSPRGRVLLETRSPEHHVVQALVRGDYRFFVRRELDVRRLAGAPPYVHLIRLQTRSGTHEALVARLRELPGTTALGPVPGGSLGSEILLKVIDFEGMLEPLTAIVRTSPDRILVEVDPKDW